jgi:5-methylcytosine-specific restriction endonuclease McrA
MKPPKRQTMHQMRLLAFKKQAGRCWLCGECLDLFLPANTWGASSWEHVIPLSGGGSDAWKNIAMTHHECNKARRDQLTWSLTRPRLVRDLKRLPVDRSNRQFQHQVLPRLRKILAAATALAD